MKQTPTNRTAHTRPARQPATTWSETGTSLPVLTANCSKNYGSYHFPEKLIPLVILNALSGKLLPIYGDRQQVRGWLYVSDYCSAICLVLEAGKLGETYNAGGWNEKTNLDVMHTISNLLDKLRPRTDGKGYAEQIRYVQGRLSHDRRYAIGPHELGWKPVETFETSIRKYSSGIWTTKLDQQRQQRRLPRRGPQQYGGGGGGRV